MLNLAQPKNFKIKDLDEAKEKIRDANTGRSVPKKRYSRNHLCSSIGSGRSSMPFINVLPYCRGGVVERQLAESSVIVLHIHMLQDKIMKLKHTPPWDVKQEREHEAANPGPYIVEALMEGRQDDWADPSEKKERQPGGKVIRWKRATRSRSWETPP